MELPRRCFHKMAPEIFLLDVAFSPISTQFQNILKSAPQGLNMLCARNCSFISDQFEEPHAH